MKKHRPHIDLNQCIKKGPKDNEIDDKDKNHHDGSIFVIN
jgi:hypothetical protein